MNLKNQPPVLVPAEFCDEIEKLSKAALMDLAWSFSIRCAGNENAADVMKAFRQERTAIMAARATEG